MDFPDYPFEPKHLDLGGHRMHFVDEGGDEVVRTDPLVMLHGNPTWSFFFRRLITALSPHYRCIAPDHIGMGLSDKPEDKAYSYGLPQRVADLEKLLDHLDVKKDITLVLHDWGGMIGMAYAVRHPERIARLIVFNTAAFHMPRGKHLPWQIAICRKQLLGAMLVRGFNRFSVGAVHHCVRRRPLTPAVRAAYLAPYDNYANRIAVHRFIQDIPIKPSDTGYLNVTHVETNLARFADLPALICWGMRDFVFDADYLNAWLGHLPRAELHRYETAGHYLLEDAHEEIIPAVGDFLERNPIGYI